METDQIERVVTELAERAKAASRPLAFASSARKNAVLTHAAAGIRAQAAEILEANARDLARAEERKLANAMIDRLRLTAERLEGVAQGVETVAALPDPVGEVVSERTLPNGLAISRVRAPLGLIGIIYESRPNVTADAAALCIKSGNAALLRGGSEAFESNQAFAKIFADALESESFARETVALLPTTDRYATEVMIGLHGVVDLIIPRGGESLIRFVAQNARVPVIQHYKGICHVFVDRDADLDMALAIALNAKTHRPGVCNAMETLLVDSAIADEFVPRVVDAMKSREVRVVGDAEIQSRAAVDAADESTWDTEHLALVLGMRVVADLDEALRHIDQHGTQHTEAIVTRDQDRAERFTREVDASLVLVNASTRFNDGFQLGLGAEIGISTTKMHAYGPMGLAELCTLRWLGRGDGQVRS